MWGTPQRSRRISTGFRKPGTATVSARSDGAIKIAQHNAAPRMLLVGFRGWRRGCGRLGRLGLAGGLGGGRGSVTLIALAAAIARAAAVRGVVLGLRLFAVTLAVIVHIPAAAFKLQRGGG